MADVYHFKSHDTFAKDILDKLGDQTVVNNAASYCNAAFAPSITGRGVRVGILDSGIVEHRGIKVSNNIANLGRSKHARDISGHAHMVAGIIGAAEPNVLMGIAPNALVACAKITDDNGLATASAIAAGLLWSVIVGMDIIVISSKVDCNEQPIKIAIDKAIECHAIVICEQIVGDVPETVFNVDEFNLKSAEVTSLYTDNRYATGLSDNFKAAILAGITALAMEKGHAMKEGRKRAEIVKQHVKLLAG